MPQAPLDKHNSRSLSIGSVAEARAREDFWISSSSTLDVADCGLCHATAIFTKKNTVLGLVVLMTKVARSFYLPPFSFLLMRWKMPSDLWLLGDMEWFSWKPPREGNPTTGTWNQQHIYPEGVTYCLKIINKIGQV